MLAKLFDKVDILPAWLGALVVCVLLVLAAGVVLALVVLIATKLVVGLVTLGIIFYWIVYSGVKDMKEKY